MFSSFPRPEFKIGQRVYVIQRIELGFKYCEHCKDWLMSHNYKWIVKEFDIAEIKIVQTQDSNYNVSYQGPFASQEWWPEHTIYKTIEKAREYLERLNDRNGWAE